MTAESTISLLQLILLVSSEQQETRQPSEKTSGITNKLLVRIDRAVTAEKRDADSRKTFKSQQSDMENRKLTLMEREADKRLEALQVETDHKRMQFKADLLQQRLKIKVLDFIYYLIRLLAS